MSEKEARFELANMYKLIRKLRIFWKTKETLNKEKNNKEIESLKNQLSNNANLWDRQAESEKRERILFFPETTQGAPSILKPSQRRNLLKHTGASQANMLVTRGAQPCPTKRGF